MGPRTLLALLAVSLAVPTLAADPQVDKATEALRKDASLKVRTQAALLLGASRSREAVPALTAALEEDDAPAVRIAAATALGMIRAGGRTTLEGARRLDPDPGVRDAAARALAELGGARPRAVALEATQGPASEPARQALRAALLRHLGAKGFAIVGVGGRPTYRLKPSVLAVDVEEGAGKTTIAVKASLIAVDGQGRMAALIEGGARARTAGEGLPPSTQEEVSAQALDVAARTLCDDLAMRLR